MAAVAQVPLCPGEAIEPDRDDAFPTFIAKLKWPTRM